MGMGRKITLVEFVTKVTKTDTGGHEPMSEERAWELVHEMFPGSGDAALARWARQVLEAAAKAGKAE
jgi:hypothetical protein